jgi:hypothetical protein
MAALLLVLFCGSVAELMDYRFDAINNEPAST